MFSQKYLQNCLLLLLAVHLIKAVVDPLCVFSTIYEIKYLKLGKIVQNMIKAAQVKNNQFVAVV